ncbi:hypothetical protein CVT24_011027 [Panaeolus cyanescens]|uniref:ribonuclease Z n=1 Tax=Panaeolus cyanescens TaxID=181874 RepID=A0A409VFY1_9AGAR|nr:hypothetical protein CVT24_011027 [Panaeolus cyanescens]
MNYSTSALTTLSSDTEPSFIITFDDAKYIFNAGENTGRSFRQNGRNWKRTHAMFFTQSTIERTSGLPGLLMTLADATINQLSLYGPDGLSHVLASMRSYSFRDSIQVKTHDITLTSLSPGTEPCFSDKNITVYAIPVLPTSSSQLLVEETIDTSSVNLSEKRKRSPSPDAPRKKQNLRSNSPAPIIASEKLQREMQRHDFQPLSLTEPLAQEYRQLVLQGMFPFTNRPEEEKVKKGKKGPSEKKKANQSTKDDVDGPPTHDAHPKADIVTPRRPRQPPPRGFFEQLPKHTSGVVSPYPSTLSYIILGPKSRGKFDVKKAEELGIFGVNRRNLINGTPIEVQIKDGDQVTTRMVQPEEVLGKPEPAMVVAVFDIPSPDHIPSLCNSFRTNTFYQRFWSEDGSAVQSSEHIVRTVYHFLGDGVLEDERYKQFMRGFGPNVHHLVTSREHSPDPLTFTTAGYNQLRLNKLDEVMFPIPKHSMVPRKEISSIPGLPPHTQALSAHHHTQLRPFSPPVYSPESEARDLFHPILKGEKPLSISPSLQACIDQAKENVARNLSLPSGDASAGANVGIYPLGTGGTLPSMYRNVLSTLIRIPGWGNIILDCGEGTWGQMARHFGTDKSVPDNAWDMLRDVKCIFASHIHGDHHMGLSQLLSKRKQLDPPPSHPLYVVSVRGVHLYLRELSDVQDIGLNDPSGNGVISVLSDALHYQRSGRYMSSGLWQVGGTEEWLDYDLSIKHSQDMCRSLGLRSFDTVDVFHRCKCYGAVIRHQDGWSISFSGDTQPTKNLVRAGAGSTVLIHEASMADEEIELAKKKSHSTIGQAIDVGKQMKAKNVLLTHFSARHPKMPPSVIEQEKLRSKDDPVVAPAFDLTSLTIGTMWKMKHYLPALEMNFDDTKDQDEGADGEVAEAMDVNVSRDTD